MTGNDDIGRPATSILVGGTRLVADHRLRRRLPGGSDRLRFAQMNRVMAQRRVRG